MELIRVFMGILLIICLILCINFEKLNTIIEEHNPGIKYDEPALLGLYVQNFKGRVRVSDILEYTPAMEAGIEIGDRIIEINGIKIKNVQSFIENIENNHDKEKIKLLVYRVDSCSLFPVEVINLGVCRGNKKQ